MRFAVLAAASIIGLSSPALSEISEPQRDLIARRACEAAIWAMPAVAVYDIELALQRDAGAAPGVVGYMSAPMDSRHGFLTANDVTPLA